MTQHDIYTSIPGGDGEPTRLEDLAMDVLERAQRLLDELYAFQTFELAHLAEFPDHPPTAHLFTFTRRIETERHNVKRYLEEFRTMPDSVERDIMSQRLRSFNLAYYEAVWHAAKSCRGITGLCREVRCRPVDMRKTRNGDCKILSEGSGKKGKCDGGSTTVDVVADNGMEWIKVVNVSERRLLFQMAGAGWDWGVEGDEALEMLEDLTGSAYSGRGGIEVVRFAADLVDAASVPRVGHYRPQRVRIFLPRITEGRTGDVDTLIHLLRSLSTDEISLTVECADELAALASHHQSESKDILFSRLLSDEPSRYISPVLNLDCTILFALCSDHSHKPADSWGANIPSARGAEDIIDEGTRGPRLAKCLYPLLGARRLVCTRPVADSFRTQALGIGTQSEIQRAGLLLADAKEDITEEERRRRIALFRELSTHEVPSDIQLPVRIVDSPTTEDVRDLVQNGTLPVTALTLETQLKELNRSAFWYGWKAGLTTVTSNRGAVNVVERAIQGSMDGKGLGVYVLPFARRLAARPKDSEKAV